MKKYAADYAFLFLVAGIIIFLDVVSKTWIRANLMVGEVYRPDLWLSQFARIVRVNNTGAAFGMFQNLGDVFRLLSFVVAGLILYYFPQIPRQDWLIRLSMGMLFGGAVGNLIDRLTHGPVTDFISLGIFPVFNVADACISIGVVVLFLGMWVQERRRKDEAPLEAEAGAEPSAIAQGGEGGEMSEEAPSE